MARLMYGHVLSNGVRINYYRTGGEKPAVILIHGLAEYGLGWGRLPVFLEPTYDVITVDLRGHGMSDKPETGYTVEDMSADIFWLIKSLNLVQPVIIGHSMGAFVAAEFARTNPKLTSGIILVDPPWRLETKSDGEKQQAEQEFRDWLHTEKEKPLAELMAECRLRNPNWEEHEIMQWSKGIQLASLQLALWYVADHTPWQEIAANLTVKGVVLCGDIQLGAIVTSEVGDLIMKLWKKCEIVQLPGAGHYIHRDQYYKFRDIVRRFLRQVM